MGEILEGGSVSRVAETSRLSVLFKTDGFSVVPNI